jgi:peroxiredoxin
VLRRARLAVLLALAACSGADAHGPAAPAPASRAGSELVGRPAGEFVGVEWLGGEARTLADLRGRVVLVRFWTDTCPYCERTAPALRRLDEEFRARGLVVIGLHHPKPRGRAVTREEVLQAARAWGMSFPIGLDRAWATVDAWWLRTGERAATSASFLIDRRGKVRLVHPGPEFTPDGDDASRRDFFEIRAKIAALLAEPG